MINSSFKFLDAYTKEDSFIFFGRESETDPSAPHRVLPALISRHKHNNSMTMNDFLTKNDPISTNRTKARQNSRICSPAINDRANGQNNVAI